MPKFDIPFVATVEADTIDEARQRAYRAIEAINEPFIDDGEAINKAMPGITLDMVDDSLTTRTNQRVVILHPEDVSNDYDVNEYNDKIKDEE